MTSPVTLDTLMPLLERIATALERAAPAAPPAFDPSAADAFLWGPERRLIPVPRVNRVEIGLLTGIDRARDTLVENTERFARGLPANNALLWGARGMGKSSLVKAAHAEINARQCLKRKLVPDDIARVALFLASDEASAITAQSYIVDGGWV